MSVFGRGKYFEIFPRKKQIPPWIMRLRENNVQQQPQQQPPIFWPWFHPVSGEGDSLPPTCTNKFCSTLSKLILPPDNIWGCTMYYVKQGRNVVGQMNLRCVWQRRSLALPFDVCNNNSNAADCVCVRVVLISSRQQSRLIIWSEWVRVRAFYAFQMRCWTARNPNYTWLNCFISTP